MAEGYLVRSELFECNSTELTVLVKLRWVNYRLTAQLRITFRDELLWEFALEVPPDDRPSEGNIVDEIRSQNPGHKPFPSDLPFEHKRFDKRSAVELRRTAARFELLIRSGAAVVGSFLAFLQPGIRAEVWDVLLTKNSGSWSMILEPEVG